VDWFIVRSIVGFAGWAIEQQKQKQKKCHKIHIKNIVSKFILYKKKKIENIKIATENKE